MEKEEVTTGVYVESVSTSPTKPSRLAQYPQVEARIRLLSQESDKTAEILMVLRQLHYLFKSLQKAENAASLIERLLGDEIR